MPPTRDNEPAVRTGELLSCQYDTGALDYTTLYGVVIAAGPKTFTVKWESGRVNRRPQGDHLTRRPTNLTPAEHAELLNNLAAVVPLR